MQLQQQLMTFSEHLVEKVPKYLHLTPEVPLLVSVSLALGGVLSAQGKG